ncbi:MAG: hypothetical protein IT536_17580 [Hyphomicrobiales bacterium]|nr:hypothetical protein [Hyphomicrobiales bacterium]
MSMRKDTDATPADAAAPAMPESPAACAAPEGSNRPTSDHQISLKLPEPVAHSSTIERPEPPGITKAVEAVMEAAESLKPSSSDAPSPTPQPVVAARTERAAEGARSHRFALLAASVAFAGALGAMAGALGSAFLARTAPAPLATDFSAVQDAIAALRAELSTIKASVESSSRNTSSQFTKFSERIERAVQAAPAQIKQAMDALDRQRSQAPADVTGSVRPQGVAVPSSTESPRQPVVEGWVVRHVSRGVAVIQGRVGSIEVEAGDIVPGLGRIQSIRRQDGRWVVRTSKGVIASTASR